MSALAASAAVLPAQRQELEEMTAPSRVVWVPQEHQLVSGTAGRIALDGYSWMQAVHWVHGAGLYAATHGPKFGETTLKLAEILSQLTPCRPSIAHLMRVLKASKRTVQYHLEILRATGLLAWRSVGTRLPMMPGQTRVESRSSEYERLIPVSYDQALGIRTAGDGIERRMTGISEEGRSLIAELGRKASKKLRRTRRTIRHRSTRQSVSTPRCTPMEGGTTDCLSSPSVGDVKATGGARDTKSSTRKKRAAKPAGTGGERRRTVLGQVVTAAMMAAGDKLARVAYRRVPWVRMASHDQLRWVLNDVAVWGWDEQCTVAWLGEIANCHGSAGLLWRPERPHGLIAQALRGEVRQHQADRDRTAELDGRAVPSPVFHDVLAEIARQGFDDAVRMAESCGAEVLDSLELSELDSHAVDDLREEAWIAWLAGDTSLVRAAIDNWGPAAARRLYGDRLFGAVGQAIRLGWSG